MFLVLHLVDQANQTSDTRNHLLDPSDVERVQRNDFTGELGFRSSLVDLTEQPDRILIQPTEHILVQF